MNHPRSFLHFLIFASCVSLLLFALSKNSPAFTNFLTNFKSKNYQTKHQQVPRYNRNNDKRTVFEPVRKVREVKFDPISTTQASAASASTINNSFQKSINVDNNEKISGTVTNTPLNHQYKEPQIDDGPNPDPGSPKKQYCFETCNTNVNKCSAAKICPDKYIQIKPPISNLTVQQKASKFKHKNVNAANKVFESPRLLCMPQEMCPRPNNYLRPALFVSPDGLRIVTKNLTTVKIDDNNLVDELKISSRDITTVNSYI